jgi:hypothetical protein
LEGRGIATVVLGTDEFRPLAAIQSRAHGLPDLPVVTVRHPIGGIAESLVADKAGPIVGPVATALTAAPARAAGADVGTGARIQRAPDDLDELQAWVMERGWGDGLPVIPPTPERVARMLAGTRRPRDEIVAVLAPRLGQATVERAAVNAVLAGALPEYLPVVLAALEALADPVFNLQAVQTTTHPCSPLIIVNGPVAARLGMNATGNALGQGTRANAAIGRAVRLALLNLGGARPGREDRATQGHPGKYSYCVAENEAESPWPSLSVERGFAAQDSTVTVCGSEGPHNVNDHASSTAEGIVATVASTAANAGHNNIYLGGEPLVALGPEHAATVANAGWSKDDFKRAVWERARVPLSAFAPENIERFSGIHPEGFRDKPLDTLAPIARDWRDIMVIVVGGAGKHSAVIPTFGMTRSVTRLIAG